MSVITSCAQSFIYWGCTTISGCSRGGMHPDSKDCPREWRFCPECGGELSEIKVTMWPLPDAQ